MERLLGYALNSMEESLVLVDPDLRIKFMNSAAEKALGLKEKTYIDKHFYNDIEFIKKASQNERKLFEEALKTGQAQKVIRKTIRDKVISMHVIPLFEGRSIVGILLTVKDVTEVFEIKHEIDMAFSLTLPNSKVEAKLKNTVEYKDRYDPETKMITITDIISDGGYRHLVNCLRLMASLYQKGITKVIGIEKDQLVQAFIFHDLGKSQPILSIGDVVDPKKIFEDGKLHAYRGAEIAKDFYHLDEDIVEIIRYHHHSEHELPETFPWRLRPMFRLFQVVDGLSAAITRGEVEVDFTVQDCIITVTERNHRPQYNGTWRIDLFTGQRIRISDC